MSIYVFMVLYVSLFLIYSCPPYISLLVCLAVLILHITFTMRCLCFSFRSGGHERSHYCPTFLLLVLNMSNATVSVTLALLTIVTDRSHGASHNVFFHFIFIANVALGFLSVCYGSC